MPRRWCPAAVIPPSPLRRGSLLARPTCRSSQNRRPMVIPAEEWAGRSVTFPGAFPGAHRGRTNDIKTRRSTATAPLHMQGCVQESRSAISGARCPDALLNGCFCTATPGYSTTVFSRGKSRVVSRASSGQEGQCHFRGPLRTKYTSPARNKLHTDGNHTHTQHN